MPPGSTDCLRSLCDSIKVERMQLLVGLTLRMQHDVTKDLPRASEINPHGAIGDGDCYLNLTRGGR